MRPAATAVGASFQRRREEAFELFVISDPPGLVPATAPRGDWVRQRDKAVPDAFL